MQRGWNSFRRLAHGTRGTELAEAAVVLPLLFMILIAIFWFGQAFRIYGTITHAARQGARAAVAPACATCAGTDPSQNAYDAVKNALAADNLDPNKLQKPAAPPTLVSCSKGGGPVSCDGGQSNICVQGVTHPDNTDPKTVVEANVQLAATDTGGAGECGISVSFQYPYSLSLPGSTLSWQVINLRAQAQMRAESQ
jgi:Flp pilus assembly protein TadG